MLGHAARILERSRDGRRGNTMVMQPDDPEQQLERTSEELDERLAKLDEHIEEAREQAEELHEDDTPADTVAGDYEDTGPDAIVGRDAVDVLDDDRR